VAVNDGRKCHPPHALRRSAGRFPLSLSFSLLPGILALPLDSRCHRRILDFCLFFLSLSLSPLLRFSVVQFQLDIGFQELILRFRQFPERLGERNRIAGTNLCCAERDAVEYLKLSRIISHSITRWSHVGRFSVRHFSSSAQRDGTN
jgi:hypothetical protein